VGRADAEVTVALVRDGAVVAAWPLAGADLPDLGLVDHLARLAAAARSLGCAVEVRGAGGAVARLLDLVGLAGLVRAGGGSVEPGGEAERGEQAGVEDVEEVVVPDDPVA
jgi:hypothetical protein